MLKSFKFRIFPSSSQSKKIDSILSLCRFLYNCALEERISFYSKFKKSRTCFDQQEFLPEIKELLPEFENIHSQILQDTLKRVDKSYKGFFGRLKTGATPGFPRFKGYDRYDSFTYPQSGFSFKEGKLNLSKIGLIKIKQHREILGKIKTCSVIRKNGKYFVCFSCEIPSLAPSVLGASPNIIGIDIGIKVFITNSNGDTVENPRTLKAHQEKLAKAQRRFAKIAKLKINRVKRQQHKNHIARIYETITNVRNDFLHKTSRKFVDKYGVIILEKLNIQSMLSSNRTSLNRNINDCAWKTLTGMISYKAEDAGKQVIFVNAAGTSQDCSSCGAVVKKDLSERTHSCKECGLVIDRDLNAAKNILNRGMKILRENRNIFSKNPASTGFQEARSFSSGSIHKGIYC